MTKVAVFSAGSWGTAFSLVLADAGNHAMLWSRRREVSDAINRDHVNADYLPDLELPRSIEATDDPEEALADADVVVLAMPSQALRPHLQGWAQLIPGDALVMSLMKGVELGTDKRMSEVIEDVAGIPPERIAVLSGPNLSHEIAQRQPAASVIASVREDVAVRLQRLCHSPGFRPYTTTDVVGCELAGAAKNVIALAVGMAIGLGFGDNSRATVITRGLAEIARLGVALGADPMTFSGLAGLGDLVATCSSPLSRNRHFGELLARGKSVDEVLASTRQVAEGVKSCESIRDLSARHGAYTPIIDHVAALIAGELTVDEMVTGLLSRATKAERD